MFTPARLLLAALALLVVGALAAAALWPAAPDAPRTAAAGASSEAVADVVAPSSSGIFPKVLNR